MPACFCKSVSVSCRSCSRIRNPSSRYDHRICVNKMLLLFLGIIRNNDSCYFLVFYTYFFHFRTKRYLNAETVQFSLKRPDYIRRMIGNRKDSVSSFNLRLHTEIFKKVDHLFIRKTVKCTI